MNLIQILLPVADNSGEPFPPHQFAGLKQELLDRFGGVTVFSQGPAEGFWQGENGTSRDQIVIFEVMTDELDEPWWRDLRARLEADFRQDEVVIRAQEMRRL
jgi:hypothetical protein